jgi:hypothetical protein
MWESCGTSAGTFVKEAEKCYISMTWLGDQDSNLD